MSVRFLLASLAITCTSAPVLASPQGQVSVEVSVTDLDLSTAKDQNRLNTRVNMAARKVCRSGRIGLDARAAEMKCVESALASAKSQVEFAIANSRSQVRIATVQIGNGN